MSTMARIRGFAVSMTLIAGACAAAMTPSNAQAQGSYPDRPVRVVVGFPPGGSTDIVARLVASKMAEGLGRPVLIENKPGAAGSIGAGDVARSPADGYTVLFQILTTAVLNPLTLKNLPYDGLKDLTPIAMIAQVPNVLIVNKDLPAKNLNELIALLKANPGKYNYGSSGTGGLMHLSGELFKQQAGVDVQHISYKGSAPAMQEMMAGTIAFMFDNITGAIGPAKSGQVRLLGVTTGQRVSIAPDVPTLAEAGLPQFKNASWFSLFTRTGVPAPIIARLEAEAIKAVNHPEIAAKLRELGAIPAPLTAAETERFWRAEFDYWGPVVRSVKLD
jgi:tripartite-type tricarboxylate transporter receptor subunit TctC